MHTAGLICKSKQNFTVKLSGKWIHVVTAQHTQTLKSLKRLVSKQIYNTVLSNKLCRIISAINCGCNLKCYHFTDTIITSHILSCPGSCPLSAFTYFNFYFDNTSLDPVLTLSACSLEESAPPPGGRWSGASPSWRALSQEALLPSGPLLCPVRLGGLQQPPFADLISSGPTTRLHHTERIHPGSWSRAPAGCCAVRLSRRQVSAEAHETLVGGLVGRDIPHVLSCWFFPWSDDDVSGKDQSLDCHFTKTSFSPEKPHPLP